MPRGEKVKFPLNSQSLVFRLFRPEEYGIDDLVVHHSRVSTAGKVMGTQENLVPSRKLRDILVGPAKV